MADRRRKIDTAEAQDRYRLGDLYALKPYDKNSNVHPPEQIAQLVESLLAFGWTRNVGVADGVIVYGHGIVQAAKQIEQAGKCPRDWPDPKMAPIVDLSHLGEAERRAYVIADNELAKRSHYDKEVLKGEVQSLEAMGLDLKLLGFEAVDLADLMKPVTAEDLAGGADADDLPDDEPFTVVEPGEVWLLGRHRLVVGEPGDVGVVAKALGEVKPHLMVTEAPGMDNADAAWGDAFSLFPGDVAYVWHDGLEAGSATAALKSAGFEPRAQIIWVMDRTVARGSDFPWQHQPCLYAAKEKKKRQFAGRGSSTVWRIPEPPRSEGDKRVRLPVECLKKCIESSSSQGHAVYDPYAGTGSVLVAAELSGRACHAVEPSPMNADMVIGRWQKVAGQEATLEGDGRSFGELRLLRAVRPASPGA